MSTLKHKGIGPQAMTANALRSGHVVYLTPDFDWSGLFEKALITEDPGKIDLMDNAAQAAVQENRVVGAYFIDIDPKTKRPARYRETFRMNGPSYDPGRPRVLTEAAVGDRSRQQSGQQSQLDQK